MRLVMVRQFYKEIWDDMNLFGRIVFYPFLLLAAPLICLIELGLKD